MCVCVCVCARVCARMCDFPSPCLCCQEFIVVGGSLVVVLSVSDDCSQTFTHQRLCYVTVCVCVREGRGGERKHIKTFAD